MNIPVIDLFSGAGGLSYGLKNLGFDIRAAVEIDTQAINTYEKNIGKVVINKDIREIKGDQLMSFAELKKGEIFLMVGCPPCQGFSSVGPRNEKDIRNQLVFEFVRLIKETEPWFIIMENVPGMSRGIGKKIFEEVKKELGNSYVLHDAILDSANYGVPQHRKRLVMHGVLKNVAEKYLGSDFQLGLPQITHSDAENIKNGIRKWETVGVIKDLPPIKAGESLGKVPNHIARSLSEINLKRIRNTPHNGGSRSHWPDDLVLKCHKGKAVYSDVYGRMSYDYPSPTITAGCLTYSKGRYGHPTQDRAISAREAARLQTFPDSFIFSGKLDSVSKQIGNAVPPKLAEASGKYILEIVKMFKDQSY